MVSPMAPPVMGAPTMIGLHQESDMTNGNERLDRIESILDRVANHLQEMAARQQYHDEAFERHDTEMKVIREAIAIDAENIRALARIAEFHNQRFEHLEGEEPA